MDFCHLYPVAQRGWLLSSILRLTSPLIPRSQAELWKSSRFYFSIFKRDSSDEQTERVHCGILNNPPVLECDAAADILAPRQGWQCQAPWLKVLKDGGSVCSVFTAWSTVVHILKTKVPVSNICRLPTKGVVGGLWNIHQKQILSSIWVHFYTLKDQMLEFCC